MVVPFMTRNHCLLSILLFIFLLILISFYNIIISFFPYFQISQYLALPNSIIPVIFLNVAIFFKFLASASTSARNNIKSCLFMASSPFQLSADFGISKHRLFLLSSNFYGVVDLFYYLENIYFSLYSDLIRVRIQILVTSPSKSCHWCKGTRMKSIQLRCLLLTCCC